MNEGSIENNINYDYCREDDFSSPYKIGTSLHSKILLDKLSLI